VIREQLSENTVRGTLTDNGIEVTGIFYFDEEGLFFAFKLMTGTIQ
jgi:hypothetical protein